MPVTLPRLPDSLAGTGGRYSHVSVAVGRQLIFVAGQVGRDSSGDVVGIGDIGDQTIQVFRNLANILDATDALWTDVAMMRTYIVGEANLELYRNASNEIYKEIFPADFRPPNTVAVVTALARRELLVEVELLAVT